MPELPEVETVARQLNKAVCGRRIIAVSINDSKLKGLEPALLTNCRISDVKRYGKQVVLALKPPRQRSISRWLAVHLRMTGRLIYAPQGFPDSKDAKPPRAGLILDRGSVGFFDTRRFGTMKVENDPEALEPEGIEPLSDEFTREALSGLMAGSKTPLKPWLMLQDKIVGIGNIYASEICYKAGLNPQRPVGSITKKEVKRVHKAVQGILKAAIRNCGTTFSDFQDASGSIGGYAKYLAVYNREGDECLTCGTVIVRTVQAQRSTFYCATCQGGDGL